MIVALCAGACAVAQQVPLAANTAEAAKRDLWLSDEGRYVRRWMLLGPLDATRADEIAKPGVATAFSEAPPGTEQRFADNSAAVWMQQRTYGDTLDPFANSRMKDGEVGFLLATVESSTAADAKLLIGGNVLGAWVNGAWVGGDANSPEFVVDGLSMRTSLKAGTNRILLRVQRLDRPLRVTLRVVEPGFIDDLSANIEAYIPSDPPGKLSVRLPREDLGTDEAGVEVIAPGGRVMATAAINVVEPITFTTTSWENGPYEVRVRGQSLGREPKIVHLPWYQGDPQPDVARVLAAASAPDADDHVKMLADMLRDRAGGDWRALHSPLMEYAELMLERAGKAGGARASGFVRLSWVDDIDGSTQFCRAYLPDQYTDAKRWPALVFLHGYNPANPPYHRWWSIAERHNAVAERHDMVVLEPMARGNVDYRWMGERDVLRCLDEAIRRLAVDAGHVSVTGESMGGNGAWLLASRHPQRFAAAAPVYGGWDYRIVPNGYSYANPQATRPMELFVREMHPSFSGAEGLLHVPVYILQGDQDTAVPVEQSRHAASMLQRWGYDVRYREIPGRGHEDLQARDKVAAWLRTHERVLEPAEVRLRSWDMAGASAYWLRVIAQENPLAMIEARAKRVGPNQLRLDTKNVLGARLALPQSLVDQPARPLVVVWNGKWHYVNAKSGTYTLFADGFSPGAHDKNPAREGRLSNFFNTPFAIVIGTRSKDAALNAGLAAKAATLADLWERWQHVKPRVYLDTEITREIESNYSLLLLGGREANRVSARLATKVPLKVTPQSVSIDGRLFPATDAVAQMIYPHPENDARYLLLVEPTSAAGLRFWNPQQYWHALNGFPLMLWDWTIVDGRHVTQASGLFPDRGWVAAGLFDTHWRRDDRFVSLGDADARSRAPLRHAPPPGFKLPADQLQAFAGRYRIDDGQIGSGGLINVEVKGDAITASAPEGGRAWPLEAESESDFAIVGLGTPVSFRRDGGEVVGVVYHYNGQESTLR